MPNKKRKKEKKPKWFVSNAAKFCLWVNLLRKRGKHASK